MTSTMSVNTEIERKFLIKRPPGELLTSLPMTEITQTYLKNEEAGVAERVRKRGRAGKYAYTHTLKRRIDKTSCFEDEREISKEAYETLLARADTERNAVYKTRFLIEKGAFTFEIDVYPFWQKQAVMEVELPDANAEFEFPENIVIIREVTGESAYSNRSLAGKIPPED